VSSTHTEIDERLPARGQHAAGRLGRDRRFEVDEIYESALDELGFGQRGSNS
jgi:hypothetical protein